MREVVIVSAARTPFGSYMGSLASQRSQDLAACSMKEAVNRAGIDSSKLDICVYSEAKQSSFPANIGRHAWLLAGLDDQNAAGLTLNGLCAGAMQTIISCFSKIVGGEYQGIMVGGIETNSQAQYYLQHPRYNVRLGNLCFHDSKVDVEIKAQPVKLYGELSAADIADIIANNYGLSRQALDEYALTSRSKAKNAVTSGKMKEAIVPIFKKINKAEVTIDTDDLAQINSIEMLMSMPTINSNGSATDGNISPLADGSASMVMMSAQRAIELSCKPIARVVGFGIAAGNPKLLERTTIKSIEKALHFAGIGLKDIDFIDFHEPSAAYSIVVANGLGNAVFGKMNVDGGSLGFGHAGAATGGAMVVNMIYRLQRTGAKYGLINVGALGGQSLSIVIQTFT